MSVLSKRKRPSKAQTAKGSTEHITLQTVPQSIPLRSRKIRFSSTSPPPKDQEVVHGDDDAQELENSHSDSDSDAAPEAISHSTAHAQSRAIDADVARAAQARSDAAKKRRREGDARLKEQASRAKRTRVEQQTTDGDGDESLPTLLPDSLLDSIPAVRPPTPPPGDAAEGRMDIDGKEARQNKHVYKGVVKRLFVKPAQDLQIGMSSVSVLESRNELLPPKADPKARGVRQNWLRGRATMVGKKAQRRTGRMERRPFGKAKTAFV
jgi:U3 small nucleolar RNA-associated protein 16